MRNDLTVLFYTANFIKEDFASKIRENLKKSIGDLPLISISQKPMDFGKNICVGDIGRSFANIYRQALIGAKAAKTKYIAMAEDDALYPPEHFMHIPSPGKFAYDRNIWGIYTWTNPPVFSWKGRRSFWTCICERELFIEAMEERFKRCPRPEDSTFWTKLFGEPGKYEEQMGVKIRDWEFFYADQPSVVFSHEESLSYNILGRRKRLGDHQSEELPYWGNCEDIMALYKGKKPQQKKKEEYVGKYDLSILIPSRNEMFLAKTIEDLLKNKRGKTEIIVGLDGELADPQVEAHPDVTIVYYQESIGQRKMTNQLCKLSNAKYIAKVDAHCSFDEGFDVKLMADMQDNWTMVPTMRNLHAFNWICPAGHIRYQGPSGPCKDCGKETKRDVCWIGKKSPQSRSYCFDNEPHFQYFNEYTKRPEFNGDLTETMSLQGSFFIVTRKKYWELDLCSEDFGSWGSQGIEVACKTWLSGGKCMVNNKTWYAHMFRTQGGDFGFPYPQSGKQVQTAKKHAKSIFFENKFPKQIYPLSWLLKKFWPIKGWKDKDLEEQFDREKDNKRFGYNCRNLPSEVKKKSMGIIYYTDNKLKVSIAKAVQKQLLSIGIPITSVSLKPMPKFGANIHLKLERGYLTMFKQILTALENSKAEVVFFCESDVLYHPSHFDFMPAGKDIFYYNTNVWKVRSPDGHAVYYNNCRQTSGICVYRETALKHYEERVELVEKMGKYDRNIGFEPGTHGRIDWKYKCSSESWGSKYPNIDIRHENNLTPSRWSQNLFRNKKNCQGWTESLSKNVDGWPDLNKRLKIPE